MGRCHDDRKTDQDLHRKVVDVLSVDCKQSQREALSFVICLCFGRWRVGREMVGSTVFRRCCCHWNMKCVSELKVQYGTLCC